MTLGIRWPETLPELVALGVGIIVGLVFAVAGWRGSAKSVELKDDPRIKSLKWAVVIGLAGFFSSWKEILNDDKVSRAAIGSFYVIALVATLLVALSSMALAAIYRARSVQKTSPQCWPTSGFSPAVEFLSYGYQHFQNALREAIDRKVEDDQGKELADLKKVVSEAARSLAASLVTTDSYLAKGGSAQDLIAAVLSQISAISRYYLRTKSHVNANWMLTVRAEDLAAGDRKRIKFAFDDIERYPFFLALKDYGDKKGARNFILPVENDDTEGLERALPGAPEAFVRRNPVYVSIKDLKFGSKIPREMQKEISKYFSEQPFTCFLSLILFGDDQTPLGIVNVESDNDGQELDEDRIRELAVALEPFLALLSLIIRIGKESR